MNLTGQDSVLDCLASYLNCRHACVIGKRSRCHANPLINVCILVHIDWNFVLLLLYMFLLRSRMRYISLHIEYHSGSDRGQRRKQSDNLTVQATGLINCNTELPVALPVRISM